MTDPSDPGPTHESDDDEFDAYLESLVASGGDEPADDRAPDHHGARPDDPTPAGGSPPGSTGPAPTRVEVAEPSGDDLLDELRTLTGRPEAEFRDGQREAIEALAERHERALVVQRTGWGKSAVYFVATSVLRRDGFGPTLLISPLLALMRNQIDAAERLGLRCMTVNSSAATTVDELAAAVRADSIDLVLVSPERLANPEFARSVMPILRRRPGLVVIDEVHCISDWGHDFRPDYRRIGRMIQEFAPEGAESSVPVLGCTATANDRVVADVAEQLGTNLTVVRGPLGRDGLGLGVVDLPRRAERLAWLAQHLTTMPGSGIVYCLTIRDTEIVADWLRTHGLSAESYSGQTDTEDREELERRLQDNEIKALVATTALGMGYDKPDLGYVVHFQMPGSPIGYYQQVGRAGRAIDESRAILLSGAEDARILDHFRDNAFPSESSIDAILAALDAAGDEPLSLRKIAESVDLSWGQIELALKQLDVEGAVERVKGQTYQRTGVEWTYPAERVRNVTDARVREQQLMVDYLTTDRCRMQYLTDQLDDRLGEPCGECDNCSSEFAERIAASGVDPATVEAGEAFLRHRPIILEPKKQGVGTNERNEVGRILSRWGDGGWGDVVIGQKAAGAFGDDVVGAVESLLANWNPTPAPEWVTAVPSLRTGDLVPALGRAVAERLGLPYVEVVDRIDDRPPQSEMQNFAYQKSNVKGAFMATGQAPSSPCLLLDDESASGWTFAEVGAQLRRAGATAVHPVALVQTSGRPG